MATRYDLLTSRKDKDGKSRYTKIGVMFPSKQGDGFSIKLEALPLANEQGEVWIGAYPPREDDGQRKPQPAQSSRNTSAEIDDQDIPF